MITAKLAIFTTDMLWESCLKFDFEQLSHSMFCKKIAHLAVAMKLTLPQQQLNNNILTEHAMGKLFKV